MITVLIISGAILITLLLTKIFIRYRPEDMSEVGIRHFQKAVLFSGISITAHLGYYALSYVIVQIFTPYQCLHFDFLFAVIIFGGNLCNAIGLFFSSESCLEERQPQRG